MCLVIDGMAVSDDISIREAGIKHTSYVEAFKKPREKLVTVQFKGKKYEFIVSDQCIMQQIITEVLVKICYFVYGIEE